MRFSLDGDPRVLVLLREVLAVSGCFWYLGCKGAGKTTRAYRELAEEVAASGRPALILDMQDRMGDVADVARQESVEGVLRELYVYERHVMINPTTEDARALLRAVLESGDVAVMVDEAGSLCDGRAIAEELDLLMRNTRKGVSLRLTSQRLGDLHQNAFATADRILVYRLQASADLDRAERAFGLDRARVAALPQFECIEVPMGFQKVVPDDGSPQEAGESAESLPPSAGA